MAAPRTLTETIDNIYTTTWRSSKSSAADNIFDATPLFFWMRDKNKIRSLAGGRFIDEPIQYAKYDSAEWLTKGGSVTLQDHEILSSARYVWTYLIGNVVRFLQDDQQNRSKHQIMRLVEAKLGNAKQNLVDTLETALAASTTTSGIDGLQLLVADDPTASSTIGGINQNTHSFWRNKASNLTGLSFATNGVSKMQTLLNNTRNNLGQKTPDIIVSGQTPYEYYKDTLLGYYRFSDKKLVDAGFQATAYEGIPMTWTPAIGTRMYFLNTEYLWLYKDPGYFMDMTNWKEPADQPGTRAAQIVSALSLVTNRRRAQGVIYNIDTE